MKALFNIPCAFFKNDRKPGNMSDKHEYLHNRRGTMFSKHSDVYWIIYKYLKFMMLFGFHTFKNVVIYIYQWFKFKFTSKLF